MIHKSSKQTDCQKKKSDVSFMKRGTTSLWSAAFFVKVWMCYRGYVETKTTKKTFMIVKVRKHSLPPSLPLPPFPYPTLFLPPNPLSPYISLPPSLFLFLSPSLPLPLPPLPLQGYILKKGHKRKNWTERWFTLKPTSISYYVAEDLAEKKGEILLDGSCGVEARTT